MPCSTWRGAALCLPAFNFEKLFSEHSDMTQRMEMRQPKTLRFAASEWVPNNPFFPVLVYSNVFDRAHPDYAYSFERLFSDAGWEGIWRNGVFSYQHYHVGAHEVLGIAAGTAELLIGGTDGARLTVGAGHCLVLPAGTGHMRISADEDFLVVGAYPPGQYADVKTSAATPRDLKTIANLPIPSSDPIYGSAGPLIVAWPGKGSDQPK